MKLKLIVISVISTLIAFSAFGERRDVTGTVGLIRYHIDDGVLAPAANKTVWFELLNPSGILCPANRVSIPPGNETAVSILLAAKMANKSVEVTVEDTVAYPQNSYCSLQYITLQ